MFNKALITKIQKFAVNDGPGFRTNVFLKGCNLTCKWCHNPETQSVAKEIFWKSRLCVQCGTCLDACPREAIRPPVPPEEVQAEGSAYYKIDISRCDRCMKCIDACRYGALEMVGEVLSVKEIIREVEKDEPFYRNSGGGMTISGGEPTMQAEFAGRLLDAAKEIDLHVCLDTSGFCQWESLEALTAKTDIVLYDLKHLDPLIHEKLTGASNKLILQNLRRLSENGTAIWLRVLVIPGFSDTVKYHQQVSEFLTDLPGPLMRIDLLPFHNWCEDKYRWLGRSWVMGGLQSIEPSTVEIFSDVYRMRGINVTVGGSGFEQVES